MSESDVSGGTNPGVVLTGSAAGERVTLDPEKVAQMSEHEARIRRALDTYSPTYPAFAADLRALLRDLDEARAMSESNWILAERTRERAERAEADLARVTEERDEARAALDRANAGLRLAGAGIVVPNEDAIAKVLAAKLERAERALRDIASCTSSFPGDVVSIAQTYFVDKREPRT